MKRIITMAVLAVATSAVTIGQTTGTQKQPQSQQQPQPQTTSAGGVASTRVLMAKEIRHELVMLPYYSVFDWLEFGLNDDGTIVTLSGQVVRPTTKSDAEARVKGIEGVAQVDNQIEVLPASVMDDQLRRSLYRAIYNFDSPLFRYGTQAVPPIHIIVDRGRATLKGVVSNKGDSNLAYIAARGVSGVFEVTNQLQVETGSAAR